MLMLLLRVEVCLVAASVGAAAAEILGARSSSERSRSPSAADRCTVMENASF